MPAKMPVAGGGGGKSKNLVSGQDLITYGKRFLGRPYVWGATGPNAFDCSGFVQYVFRHFGINLPRVTFDQVKKGTPVERGQHKIGDLIFSSWDGKPHSHVGIYAGDGKILHAGKPVQIRDLDANYWSHVDAIRRIAGVDGAPSASGSGVAEATAGGASAEAGGLLSAVQGIAEGIGAIASGTRGVGQLADAVLKLALPTTMVRLTAGLFGIGFVVVGVLFLLREVRDA